MKLVLVALALAAPFGLAMGPSKAGTCVFADQECAWESPTSDVCADSCNNVGIAAPALGSACATTVVAIMAIPMDADLLRTPFPRHRNHAW